MQCNLLSTSSISALLVLTLTTVFTESAFAQCVNSHVGVQLNISRLPAKQGSNIEMESTGPCTGNVNSSTATQVNIGGQGQAEQQQNVNQLLLVQKQISEAELKLQKLSPANNQNE